MRRRVTDDEQALLARALADVKPLKRKRRKKPGKNAQPTALDARVGAEGSRSRGTASHPRSSRGGVGGEPRPAPDARGGARDASIGRAEFAALLPPCPPSRRARGGVPGASGGDAPAKAGAQLERARRSALVSGDPAIETKARRGKIEIERTLDLHGLRQASAETRLGRFIEGAYKDGCRCVLVVTGKGAPLEPLDLMRDPSPRGIIRARFLDWIESASLRAMIARVGRAAPRHGGAGAFYVFLKKRR